MLTDNVQAAGDKRDLIERFVAICQADERIVAATLYGSRAREAEDDYSDLDLGVITAGDAYEDFLAGRDDFIRLLGRPLFIENFGRPDIVLFILSDGASVELDFARADRLDLGYGEPYRVLLDRAGILAGVRASIPVPDKAEQLERLRQQIFWFWHDLEHFTAAMARGQLWWASGQLEMLRRNCANLARLRHNFADPGVGEDPYFKIDKVLSPEELSPLETTFGPREAESLWRAAHIIIAFYREIAQPLALTHGIPYPAELDRLMVGRLEKLFARNITEESE